MADRQVAVVASSQAVSALLGDQNVVAIGDLHQQRLIEREEHHHKQLWTKDPHGGPYRKVLTTTYMYKVTVGR